MKNFASRNGFTEPTIATRDIDAGLQIASGKSDWIGQHFDVVYALLVFAAALLCVVLVAQILRLRTNRLALSRSR